MVLNAHTDPMTEEQRKELKRLCDASGRQHMIEETLAESRGATPRPDASKLAGRHLTSRRHCRVAARNRRMPLLPQANGIR
ncbi:hypothetical protein V1294_003413 [Bradyrhizobium sp. AZCC 1678]